MMLSAFGSNSKDSCTETYQAHCTANNENKHSTCKGRYGATIKGEKGEVLRVFHFSLSVCYSQISPLVQSGIPFLLCSLSYITIHWIKGRCQIVPRIKINYNIYKTF